MKEIILFAVILMSVSSHAQVKKDTLYFSYDNEYFVEYKNGKKFSIIDTGKDEEYIIFIRGKTCNQLEPENVLNLKDFIRNSSFYNSNRQNKLNDYRLVRFLNRYELFLVEKGKNDNIQFTKLFPATEIID